MGDGFVLRGASCLQGELGPDNGYKGHMREGFGHVGCQVVLDLS